MAKPLQSLFDKAVRLKRRGKLNDAIAVYRTAVKQYPDSGVAEHNLAGALGDAGRASEAESHIRRAFKKGLNAPQSWLVLARALLTQSKVDEAREAFEKTLELNPSDLDALRELAQLIWMMTGDSAAALARIDDAIQAHPDVPVLHHLKTEVLKYTKGPARTFEFARSSLERWPDDVNLLAVIVDAGTHSGEIDAALAASERFGELQPGSFAALESRACALLAAGRPGDALPVSEQLVTLAPHNQHALAVLATNCRLLDDDRYAELYNYEAFVRPYELATPKGWSSLSAYLDDLRAALRERHPYEKHPFSNSLDGGSMIFGFAGIDDPPIRSLFHAISPAIDEHIRHLGKGTDSIRSRNTGRWEIDGIWSVFLQPNGFHHDHVHPEGWLSSACYIELPDTLESGEKEGWIKFGEPGIVTEPALGWEHAVKPSVGKIVLFPSYMWHGTIPFGGDNRRMTCALDIVPE